MKNITTDRQYMKRALALARKGGSRVLPNPRVGCVIINQGAVVGAGYHEYFGGPHAEINALKAAGSKARGGTMYVTLEPCSHWGKTPPCSAAIVKSGLRRVVAAMKDPNPRIRGNGLQQLVRSGLQVEHGLCGSEARALNRDYLRSIAGRRSQVTVKAALSIDGKIATRTGDSRWITGKKARSFVHALRSKYDAVLVGIGTVLRDDPELTSHGRGRNPVRVVIDPRLRIPPRSRVIDNRAPTAILCRKTARASKRELLRKKGVLVIELPSENGATISFRDIIRRLADCSLNRILIEGGGTTIARALESGVVTDALFFVSPKIIGGKDAPTPVEGTGSSGMSDATRLRRVSVRRFGDDILIAGRLR